MQTSKFHLTFAILTLNILCMVGLTLSNDSNDEQCVLPFYLINELYLWLSMNDTPQTYEDCTIVNEVMRYLEMFNVNRTEFAQINATNIFSVAHIREITTNRWATTYLNIANLISRYIDYENVIYDTYETRRVKLPKGKKTCYTDEELPKYFRYCNFPMNNLMQIAKNFSLHLSPSLLTYKCEMYTKAIMSFLNELRGYSYAPFAHDAPVENVTETLNVAYKLWDVVATPRPMGYTEEDIVKTIQRYLKRTIYRYYRKSQQIIHDKTNQIVFFSTCGKTDIVKYLMLDCLLSSTYYITFDEIPKID